MIVSKKENAILNLILKHALKFISCKISVLSWDLIME